MLSDPRIPVLQVGEYVKGLTVAAHSLPFNPQDNIGSNRESIELENKKSEEMVTETGDFMKKSYKGKANISEHMYRC